MAKFLTTQKAYAEIEDITRKAERELVLISPYIKIPDNLLVRFKYLDKKNIKITLVCRGEDLKTEERIKLSDIEHLELRFLESLHAKCFYNQESMVITSLNLYDYSQQNNREMGVLLTLKDDHDIFLEAREEANFIVNEANVEIVNKQSNRFKDNDVKNKRQIHKAEKKEQKKPKSGLLEELGEAFGLTEKRGYCIRGGERIPYDITHPLCGQHWVVWNEHKDPDYKEHYCHRCGERYRTSFNKPECPSCYKKS